MKYIIYSIILIIGCSKTIDNNSCEWVGKDKVYYIHFKGDSLAYTHGTLSIKNKNDKRIIRYVDGTVSEKLIYHRYKNRFNNIHIIDLNGNSKYIGKFVFYGDSMRYFWNDKSLPISFRKLLYDSTIHLKKLQFSAFGCYGNCPVFDFEIDSTGKLSFTAKMFFTKKGTYIYNSNINKFKQIQDIIRKSFISEIKERNQSGCSDVPEYSMTVYYNNQQKSMRYDACNLDPEFIPLLSEIYSFDYLDNLLKTDKSLNRDWQ